MYPSLQIEDIISITLARNYEHPGVTVLDNALLHDLLSFCLAPKAVQVGTEFYLMSSGVAMGSPLSSILADLQMWDMEDTIILQMGSSMSHYFRFADDVLVVCRTSAETLLHSLFNNYRPHTLKFIRSQKIEGWLPFLDISIKISRNFRFLSQILVKPQATFNYLKYSSFGPFSQKKGVVFSVLKRIIDLSSPQFRYSAKLHFTNLLLLNGYPLKLINDSWAQINKSSPPRDRPSSWIKLPFIKNRFSNKKITTSLRDANLGVVFSGGKSLHSKLPSLYPSRPKLEQRNVVYEIPFTPPSLAVYTGQTKRPLLLRLEEHARDIRRRTASSSLASFCASSGQTPDFANTKIIARSPFKNHRLIKENLGRMLHYRHAISKINPLNFRPPIKNFAGIYASSFS